MKAMKNRPEAGRKRRLAAKPTRTKLGQPPAAGTTEPEAKPQAARLHKVMAAAGLGSRRALEQEIRAGAIKLNGAVATLGQSLKQGDLLQWGEREWRVSGNHAQHRTLVYNKPEGEITSRSDPEGRPTVFDSLPFVKDARWVTIGRLDINTTGLLLLTTDGELANAMMHPSSNVDREYVCRVRGIVSDEELEKLRTGVQLEDGPARFSDVQRMGGAGTQASANQWFQLTLLEGRNREVRRVWEALGHMVSRLKRVRYGAALLPKGLKVGRWHELNARDHQILREDIGLATATAELTLQAMRQPAIEAAGPGRRPSGPTRHQARKIEHDRLLAGDSEFSSERPPANRRSGKAHGQAAGQAAGRAASRSNKATLRSADTPWKSAAERNASQRTRKPGSPAGQGRRPHPKSRRGER
jgi:23S rRNA pseudouridine2605 synthase